MADTSPQARQARNLQAMANAAAVIQGVFIKTGATQWRDNETDAEYDQIEVQKDRVKVSGPDGSFYIERQNGVWNRELPPYSQARDPGIAPFLQSGRSFMGERGARDQLQGKTPPETHVRETARTHPSLDGGKGSGLHELLPTNLRGKVAQSGSQWPISIQSGMRSSTALTAFNRTAQERDDAPTGSDEVGFHTGFASAPSKTRGQGPAHDRMRGTLPDILAATSFEDAVNAVLSEHIEATPTGEEIRESIYITGTTPNLAGSGEIEPVNARQRPNRIALAKLIGEIRESVKTRSRSIKRKYESTSSNPPPSSSKHYRARSPSPPRSRIEDDGTGGAHFSLDRMSFPVL